MAHLRLPRLLTDQRRLLAPRECQCPAAEATNRDPSLLNEIKPFKRPVKRAPSTRTAQRLVGRARRVRGGAIEQVAHAPVAWHEEYGTSSAGAQHTRRLGQKGGQLFFHIPTAAVAKR